MRAKKFTEKEINDIITDYENGMRPFELAKKYNRDSGTLIGKLKSLGIYKNTCYRFSDEDIEFLRVNYPAGNYEEIKKRFPNSKMEAIYTVCYKHGIKAEQYYNETRWTKTDLDILQNNYESVGAKGVYELMGKRHSIDAIRTKALRQFGFEADRAWSDEENMILRNYYPVEPLSKVVNRLPRRTYQSITTHAKILGLESYAKNFIFWTDEDDKFLLDNWFNKSDDSIAICLGRTKKQVMERRWRLGLLRCHHYSQSAYSDLTKYLRGNIGTWKSDSMRKCNYKCVITGDSNFEIHHLYSFSQIVSETIEENNFELKEVFSDYDDNELQYILNRFIEKQLYYGLGVCIRKDLHILFHQRYGKVTTPEMWDEFINSLK